jgi:hypothetical protein
LRKREIGIKGERVKEKKRDKEKEKEGKTERGK